MIYIDLSGRLGNQMFQYAVARKIQIETGNDLAISSYTSAKNNFVNSLGLFHVTPFVDLGKKHNVLLKDTNLIQKIICYAYFFYYKKICRDMEDVRIFQVKMQPFLNHLGICWMNKGFYKFNYSYFKKGAIIKGNFENPLFFNDIRHILKKEFTPIEPPRAENKELYRIIEETNSVCVSIRRCAYLTDPQIRKYFHTYEDNYFIDAMNTISQDIKDAVFIIFSDDIDWVKENMTFNHTVYYEAGDDPVWEKLRMMYSCKHFILSNSTFSWWAQYLSDNKDKIVVAPKKWLNDRYVTELYGDNWILL